MNLVSEDFKINDTTGSLDAEEIDDARSRRRQLKAVIREIIKNASQEVIDAACERAAAGEHYPLH